MDPDKKADEYEYGLIQPEFVLKEGQSLKSKTTYADEKEESMDG